MGCAAAGVATAAAVAAATTTSAESRGRTNITGSSDQWAPGDDRGRLIPSAPSLPRLAADDDRALMSFTQTFERHHDPLFLFHVSVH